MMIILMHHHLFLLDVVLFVVVYLDRSLTSSSSGIRLCSSGTDLPDSSSSHVVRFLWRERHFGDIVGIVVVF